VYFFVCSVFCDSWPGSRSSCLLEVVASYAGEEVGAHRSWDSHQVVSAQSKKENRRRQSSICCKRLQTLGLNPSVRSESAIVVPSFPIS
jgi:hypothetical protein